MTGWLDSLLRSVPVWLLYAAVFASPFLEASLLLGLLVPGETALILGGALAGHGDLSLSAVLALGIAGAIVGDSAGYALGRRFGPAIELSRLGRLVGERRWTASGEILQRRGASAVFVARFTALLRSVVPGAAGMAQVPYRTFLVWNVVGGVIWATLCVFGGWAVGQAAGAYASDVGYVVFAVTTALLLVHLARNRRRRARAEQSAAECR